MTADWSQLKVMFPLVGRVLERQVLRVEALRRLSRKSQEEDETDQLRKIEVKEMLSALVKLEEWK
ncbi:hypothetical protein HQ586_06390 [Candidatus Bathyarchaeota archaeon]|nr:hypothetical protein [Candidatus Bathyarchaeota archaeon]